MHFLLFGLKNGRYRSQATVFRIFLTEIKDRKGKKTEYECQGALKTAQRPPKGPQRAEVRVT